MVRGRSLFVLVAACGRLDFDRLPTDQPPPGARCPEEMVLVGGNAALGTGDVCVMRFEAKARDATTGEVAATGCDAACTPNSLVDTHVPAAVPDGEPWHTIDALTAQRACRSLGAGYDLMSNREWMTIAREVELVGANWSGGVPGSGRMIEGNTDATGSAAVTDPSDPYSDTGNGEIDPPGAGWEQRRTVVLANGEVLWDLPGNVQEWIDWTVGGDLDGAPTPCSGDELPAFSCPSIAFDDFNSSTGAYDSTNGVGTVIGGNGNATRRGGQQSDLSLGIAGIYALNMNRFTDQVFPGTGFRCVLRL
jgi:hypothetical protein